MNGDLYRALAYYRLSKEDKDKAVSDSIENQKKLIHEYVARHDDIELIGEYYDDGYTGTNYNRPGFCSVMQAVNAGHVDCIIVKDLSRLGREYIETGKYLEETFPSMGIRFVAVNDGYDSSAPKQSDDILIPVKNLINETYCRELSRNLRRQFAIQRRNGEYLGAFASYGYMKSPEDKHKLIVDDFAAQIVKEIFYAKMQGYSQQAIADTLNREGVLCPSEYKRQQGLRYQSGFSSEKIPKWTAVTVTKILKNSLYIGELIQGKRGTPNFKVKTVRERKPDEWIVVKNNHEPLVDHLIFETVQKIFTRDIRTSPKKETVLPLGGTVFCADCGSSMLVRSVCRCGKKFFYYVCSANKRGRGCSSHCIEKTQLERAVLNAIKVQIASVVDLEALLKSISSSELLAIKVSRLKRQIEAKDMEIERYRDFKSRLFEALKDELIDHDEFIRMRDKYRAMEAECGEAVEALHEKIHSLDSEENSGMSWVALYAKYQDLTELSRESVVALIDRISIYEDKRVQIDFNYRDDMRYCLELVSESTKEVG